jgi:hypothetical protein
MELSHAFPAYLFVMSAMIFTVHYRLKCNKKAVISNISLQDKAVAAQVI